MTPQRMSFITVASQFGTTSSVSDKAVSSEISSHSLCVFSTVSNHSGPSIWLVLSIGLSAMLRLQSFL